MRLIRQIFNFYIFSNLHVAVGVLCFVKMTLLPFDIDENNTALFVFFATVLSYNFIRFLNIPKQKNWISNWFIENRLLMIILSGICVICCVYFLFKLKRDAILVLPPFMILTFFYGMKLPRSMVSLRGIPGLKIFVIAFCFSGITILFPLVQHNIEIDLNVWILFLQRFFFVILITIPFDIRDVWLDNTALKTIPQNFGIRAAKLFGIFLGMLVVFIAYRLANDSMLITSIASGYAVTLLVCSSKKQSRYYSSFFVESIPIIWFVLILVERNLNS
jgi:hypothetical protein